MTNRPLYAPTVAIIALVDSVGLVRHAYLCVDQAVVVDSESMLDVQVAADEFMDCLGVIQIVEPVYVEIQVRPTFGSSYNLAHNAAARLRSCLPREEFRVQDTTVTALLAVLCGQAYAPLAELRNAEPAELAVRNPMAADFLNIVELADGYAVYGGGELQALFADLENAEDLASNMARTREGKSGWVERVYARHLNSFDPRVTCLVNANDAVKACAGVDENVLAVRLHTNPPKWFRIEGASEPDGDSANEEPLHEVTLFGVRFTEYHTGGGCLALAVDTPDGGQMLITSAGGGELPSAKDWILGIYDPEGELICGAGASSPDKFEIFSL